MNSPTKPDRARELPGYAALRFEARPYAEAIVAARNLPASFNQADVEHAIRLEQDAIASTAVTLSQTVPEVVERHYPELFGKQARRAA